MCICTPTIPRKCAVLVLPALSIRASRAAHIRRSRGIRIRGYRDAHGTKVITGHGKALHFYAHARAASMWAVFRGLVSKEAGPRVAEY